MHAAGQRRRISLLTNNTADRFPQTGAPWAVHGGRGKWFWASSNCASSQTTWIDTLTLVDPNSTQLSYTHRGSHSHTFSSERSRKSGETVSTVSSAAVNNCVQAPWYLPCSVSPVLSLIIAGGIHSTRRSVTPNRGKNNNGNKTQTNQLR